jgi:signal-transduction protein with cAMP-binding, CBS, and nucleotidyltransferase domain
MTLNPKWQKPQSEWTETMINRFVRVFPVSLEEED